VLTYQHHQQGDNMVPTTQGYLPSYSGSHALIVGINKYKCAGPLAFAADDARAVADTLIKRFGFPRADVTLLLDAKATKKTIMQSYLRYANSGVGSNDRILVFFAGHGHTVAGRRETGFLVPVEGDIADLSTLIRWDELTRNADLIQAKHMLFLMDACYGGLAVTRKPVPPGSSRFLEDMLMRHTRQVITAGKGDEVVSDGNGTRPNHSIFTSHLLDALDGAAVLTPGVTTAMGVMAYVYDKVGRDTHSKQTPHFGFIDGDGDFIFEMPVNIDSGTSKEGEGPKHSLVKLPEIIQLGEPTRLSIGEQAKAFLAKPAERIHLDDLVIQCLRRTTRAISPANYPAQYRQGTSANEQFAERIKRYEYDVTDLETLAILLVKWADPEQLHLVEKIFSTLGEIDMPRAGTVGFMKLAWYPVACVMYAAGISAVAASRYDALHRCLFTPIIAAQSYEQETKPIIDHVVYAMNDLNFNALPGAERQYTPRSEHMFAALQPVIEDQLFVGRRYEEYFDRFEIILALSYGNMHTGLTSPFWGPPGRFAWKERNDISRQKPFSTFVEQAKAQGQKWPALKAGFFNGSAARFAEVADGYAQLIQRLSWM